MAKLLSHTWSTIRGSVGGITYTANQFAQIIARHRTSPVNPNTTRQAQIRADFTDAENLWKSLTDAQRNAWNQYSEGCIRTGPLGTYTAPGRNTFMGNIGLREYFITRGLTFAGVVNTAPTNEGFALMANPLINDLPAPGDGFQLEVENNNPEDVFLFAEISRPFNPTRYRFKGPFNSESLAFSSATAQSAKAQIDFTGLATGKVYFVRFGFITDDDPTRISVTQIMRVVARTTPV